MKPSDFGPWILREDEADSAFVALDDLSPTRRHYSFGRLVWRMEGEEQSPKCEHRARLAVSAPALHAALLAVDARIRDAVLRQVVGEDVMRQIAEALALVDSAQVQVDEPDYS